MSQETERDPAEMTEAESALLDKKEREQLFGSARQIIECGDVLNWFVGSWRKIVAGEEKNAKLLYLVATSRLFPTCMSAAVKGPSAVGKSNIRKGVLQYFPPENIVTFTTMSEKALLYFEDDFQHKILSMGEAAGTEEKQMQDYLLRELISEGVLHYPVPIKVEGKGIVTQTVVKHGPVAFLVTTTKAALHPENETRMLSLEVDDSECQTRRVLDKVAETVGRNSARAVVDFEPWQDFQRWLALGNLKVDVPFAAELGRLIVSAKAPRLRRDFSQILLAIKAHALLNQFHRNTDDQGQIVAEINADYVPVAELMGGIMSEASGVGIEPALQETINAVKIATADLHSDEGATAFEIAKLLKLDKSAAWRRLGVAQNKGYVVNLETRKGQSGRYRVTDQEIEPEPLLPSGEALAAAMQPVQPCNRKAKAKADQERAGCSTGCTVASDSDAHATAQPPRNRQVYDPTQEIDTGCTVAPIAQREVENSADFEERAAILEFNAGLSRDEAERVAREELEIPVFLRRGAA